MKKAFLIGLLLCACGLLPAVNAPQQQFYSISAYSQSMHSNQRVYSAGVAGVMASVTSGNNRSDIVLNSEGVAVLPRIAMRPVSGTRQLFDPLNDDGDGATTGIRRAPGTPGSSGEQLPIGDAAIPMLLMALVYCAVKRRNFDNYSRKIQ